MGSIEYNCPLCGTKGEKQTLTNDYAQHFYSCEICGRYAISDDMLEQYDNDKLAAFLYYKNKKDKYFFYYIGNEKSFNNRHVRQPIKYSDFQN